MKKILLVIVVMILNFVTVSFAIETQFTQADRDRLTRVETKLDESIKRLDESIKSLQKEIDELRTFMLWGFGILFGGMGLLMGFVIWDRRTALSPVVRRNRELEEREELIEKVLKEYAKVEPKFAEILKSLKLL